MYEEYDQAYEYEGDLSDAGYWGSGDTSDSWEDSVDFDLESFNDDWTSDYTNDWEWDYQTDYSSKNGSIDSALDSFFKDIDESDGNIDSALHGFFDEIDNYKPEEKDGAMKSVVDFLKTKTGGGLAQGLVSGAFSAWQQQQSMDRADKLSDREYERAQELMKLKASLSKGGGGGGKPPAVGIAPKTEAGKGQSVPGNFTKRV